MGTGWEVHINGEEFDKDRKKNSVLVLKSIWGNLDALFKGGELREIKLGFAKISIWKIRGIGWLTLPIFPFAFLHENLHFVISYFTNKEPLIQLVPPVLDLFYLPVLLLWVYLRYGFGTVQPNLLMIFLPLIVWVEWAWIVLLMSNLKGDFANFRANRKKPENPEKPKT